MDSHIHDLRICFHLELAKHELSQDFIAKAEI